MAEFIKAVEENRLDPDQPRQLNLAGAAITLARTSEGIFAFADRCTHEGCSLSGGQIIGKRIECPCHGAQFDLASGAVLALPATVPLKTYPVKVEAGWVWVEI